MIVFADYEHADVETAKWRDELFTASTWITYRLGDLSGQHFRPSAAATAGTAAAVRDPTGLGLWR